MLKSQILDLNDKMNSLVFYFENIDTKSKSTVKVEKGIMLSNLDSVQENILSEVERLNGKLPLLEKSLSVGKIKGFESMFKKNMVVHMSLSYKIDNIKNVIKGLENREIEIPQHVANYFENV